MATDDVIGLVFDLPDEASMAEIRRMRAAHDHDRLALPVENTVAGSSGPGWFSPNQTIARISAMVRDVAKTNEPFHCFFSRVETFPESHLYYLALRVEEPFRAFQRILAASPLQFEPTPFSYKPHCTIAAPSEDAPASAHAEIAAFAVPHHGVTICSVSLYSVNRS